MSVSLSFALRRQIARHPGPLELEEMVEFAVPFLSRGYRHHLEAHGPETEGFRRVYFILAGYVPDSPPPHFQMVLLGSEENELPLKIPAGNLVVMPRNLGMEMRLSKALNQGAPWKNCLRGAGISWRKWPLSPRKWGRPFIPPPSPPAASGRSGQRAHPREGPGYGRGRTGSHNQKGGPKGRPYVIVIY